jgi:hypothetical protein
LLIFLFVGCGQSSVGLKKNKNQQREFPITYSEYRKFLMDKFNMTEEEMGTCDVSQFVDDYALYKNTLKYNSSEIKEIFADSKYAYEGKMFAPMTIFNNDLVSGALPKDYNRKTLDIMGVRLWGVNDTPETLVFVNHSITREEDHLLYKQLAYSDLLDVKTMPVDSYEKIYSIIEEHKITNWAERNLENKLTVGNFSWELIFVFSDGETAKYSGYADDDFYPPEYRDVINEFMHFAD